jgi:sec-independent protein translocase protein TatA
MPFNVGPMELMIVLVIALIVLGPKRLPDAGRALGSGIRNFKRGLIDEPARTGAEPPAQALDPAAGTPGATSVTPPPSRGQEVE